MKMMHYGQKDVFKVHYNDPHNDSKLHGFRFTSRTNTVGQCIQNVDFETIEGTEPKQILCAFTGEHMIIKDHLVNLTKKLHSSISLV